MVDEDAINNMSIVMFTEVLKALAKKLNFESISNLYGNSFALKEAQKHITEAYPLKKEKKISDGTMSIFNQAKVVKIGKSSANALAKSLDHGAGDDHSYLMDMFAEISGQVADKKEE